MKKTFKLVEDGGGSSQSGDGRSSDGGVTDWSLCFLCQSDQNGDELVCPADRPLFSTSSYDTLSTSLLEFDRIGALPSGLSLARLDDGHGISTNLFRNRAKFHKVCSLQFNTKALKRAQKRRLVVSDTDANAGTKFTRRSGENVEKKQVCFFCGEPGSDASPLHNVCTFAVDTRVRRCANYLQDLGLIAKLSAGDMMATEAKYHGPCLSSLYKRESRARKEDGTKSEHANILASAFAELLSFIQLQLEEVEVAPVFRLRDLTKMYEDRVRLLGGDPSSVHATRLKEKILNYFPDLTAYSEGRNVLLACRRDVGAALRRSCEMDAESEAIILSRAANIVRRELFQKQPYIFPGSFEGGCQRDSVPTSLITLTSLIMNGTSIDEVDRSDQAALTVSQLIAFNSSSFRRSKTVSKRRSRNRETPLPLFVGAFIHSKFRSKEMIDRFSELGLSVSYDRVLKLSASLGNSAIEHYMEIGKVVPRSFAPDCFIVAAVDNIDHNPSATSARSAFHGTGISLFQFRNSAEVSAPEFSISSAQCVKRVMSLPGFYADVIPARMLGKPHIPVIPDLVLPESISLSSSELEWCHAVNQFVISTASQTEDQEDCYENVHLSWAAYHGALETENDSVITCSSLLPLFREDSKSVAMMIHAMRVIKDAIAHTSPNQVPVMECDQPLFKLARDIQFDDPEAFGEDKFVVLLGKLHILMTLLKCLGDLLDGSGWTGALSAADVASSGTADSFLKASHVKRCLRAHQVTACALFILRKQAYTEFTSSCCTDDPATDEVSRSQERANESPQFFFWDFIMQTQLDVLAWSRSVHSGDFDLYVKTLRNLLWLFFSLDHQNYARAASLHVRDMVSLEQRLPDVATEFRQGKFTLRKTCRSFSRIGIDEGHEQNNALIKGEGGAVGLTENPQALLRWMVAGPEMARLVNEFSAAQDIITDQRHHEDTPSKQKQFLRDVKSLVTTIADMGNPFLDDSGDLIVLDTRRIMNADVVASLRSLKSMGQTQADDFFASRFVSCTAGMSDPLKKNKALLFSNSSSLATKSKKQLEISALKADRNLFSRLYIACQVRQGDLEEFFRHENQPFPPALSENGDLYLGKKSDLLECLASLVGEEVSDSSTSTAEMIVLDGAAVVHFLRPQPSDTFGDYAQKFVNYVGIQFTGQVKRVDVVFDKYISDSLKAALRQKRGTGARIRVEAAKRVPKNWSEFLREDGNKRELFECLGNSVAAGTYPGKVVVTAGDDVVCSVSADLSNLMPCTHEEADYRMILHAADGCTDGLRRILIRTVDTDVVVLATAFFGVLTGCENLRVALGVGKSFRMFDVSSIATALGPARSSGLLFFHAFSGSDTTSAFRGKGKPSAFKTWTAMPEVNETFQTLSKAPSLETVEAAMPALQRFVVVLYDRASPEEEVDAARLHLFAKKARAIESIPPTSDALRLHVLRSSYQAGHVWGQALEKGPELPDPALYGWRRSPEKEWQIQWTTLPAAAKACLEVYSCRCKNECSRRCGCSQRALPCTHLCGCHCDLSGD